MKKVFRELTKDEFEEFTKSCPSKRYMQSVEMYERYQKNGYESYLLGVLENKKIVSAGLVFCVYKSRGGKVFSFPRGPLVDYKKDLDSFYFLLTESKKFLKAKGGMLLQTSPNFLANESPKNFNSEMKKLHFKYLGEYERVKWIYTISFNKIKDLPEIEPKEEKTVNINPSLDKKLEQTLIQSFRRDHRVKIRQAVSRHNLSVRELKPEEYDILSKLLEESGKFQGYRPRDQKFFKELNKAFHGKATAIIAELPDKTPVAVGFFVIHGDEVIYLFSGINRDYKQLGGQHLIQWTMIRYAYANGYKKYNFWGTHPEPDNGVFNFKQGFHGEIEEFVGTFATPLNLLGKLYIKKLRYSKYRDI